MGSLPASGVPVVLKQPVSFRKHDIRIKSTDSRDDSIVVITDNRPALNRAIGSGSIVRNSGVVDYYEEKVAAAYLMGRTTQERIASDPAALREVVVDLNGLETLAVIPEGLEPDKPQLHAGHRGNKIGVGNSADDSLTRVSNSGAFDQN